MLYILFIIMLIIGLIFFTLVSYTALNRGWGAYIRSMRRPLVSASATVASKREEMIDDYSHNFERRFGEIFDPNDTVRLEPIQWFLTFECDDGETREFSVRRKVYESAIVGDEGQLEWRGSYFIRFYNPSAGPNLDDTPRSVRDDWL
ncbi:MAG: DUF2500 family protein [Armatimonadota bacterium]|nr:DUF2500 family protein [Armatimonadota bacterium]